MPIEIASSPPQKSAGWSQRLQFNVSLGATKVTPKERMLFTERLSLLLETGVSVHSALETLAKDYRGLIGALDRLARVYPAEITTALIYLPVVGVEQLRDEAYMRSWCERLLIAGDLESVGLEQDPEHQTFAPVVVKRIRGMTERVVLPHSFFVGADYRAIARIAALHFAREEKSSMGQALRFSTGKALSFFTAPLIPMVIILVLGVLMGAGGLLIALPPQSLQ